MQFSLHSRPARRPVSGTLTLHTKTKITPRILKCWTYFSVVISSEYVYIVPSASYILKQKQNDFFYLHTNISQTFLWMNISPRYRSKRFVVVARKVLIGGTQFIWREILNGKMFTQDRNRGNSFTQVRQMGKIFSHFGQRFPLLWNENEIPRGEKYCVEKFPFPR